MENNVPPSPDAADRQPKQSTGETAASNGDREPTMQRAEELADQFIERFGAYASWIGHQVLKFQARVKEEASDIWAEAEHIADNWRAPQGASKEEG
jgi:hypothetical protein